MEFSQLILHSNKECFSTSKILITAEYCHVNIELSKTVQQYKDDKIPEFIKTNFGGMVPILDTPNGTIFESNAIVGFVAKIQHDIELYGKTLLESGQVEQWIHFCSNELEPPGLLWIHNIRGLCSFNDKSVKSAEFDVFKALNILDQHLLKRNYLVGDKISLADISVGCFVVKLYQFVLNPEAQNRFSSVTRWLTALLEQPQWRNVLGEIKLCQNQNKQNLNQPQNKVNKISKRQKNQIEINKVSKGQSKNDNNNIPENIDEPLFVACLTPKQLKAMHKPTFERNPDEYYPTKTLKKYGYNRKQCTICRGYFWHHKNTVRDTCGDSNCEKRYSFIGTGCGIGHHNTSLEQKKQKHVTYSEVWEGFQRVFLNPPPDTGINAATAIPRYPVVARWRDDVDYVNAGIYCYQPYCVTGEMEPPANPLICPQFCLRFNDLDNIGITGRHYSGFIMIGIQAFNKRDNPVFWKEQCTEMNIIWLTHELKIPPGDITFIEDVWAGGGNLGPSVEYFVKGLELGNMVFMQYKSDPNGDLTPLEIQVIDVGIGHERIPWLLNGSSTSYLDVFPQALEYLTKKCDIPLYNEMWEKYGPYSCTLNVDETSDMDATWNDIASMIGDGKSSKEIKKLLEPARDAYIVCDHTRTVLLAIEDGSLPSNVGGASNVRNILRRVFALLHKERIDDTTGKKSNWWEKLTFDGFFTLFEKHKQDLKPIFGEFKEYKSFRSIIEVEFDRWRFTEGEQKLKLKHRLDQLNNKKIKFGLEDWITCITAWGLPADKVAEVAQEYGYKLEIPLDLYNKMAERKERLTKAPLRSNYDTANLHPTESIYFDNHLTYQFDGRIIEVFEKVETESHQIQKKNSKISNNNTIIKENEKTDPKWSVIVLDKSAFYPFSGGQACDLGQLKINDVTYSVVDVLKVGPSVLHFISPHLPSADKSIYLNMKVTGYLDQKRRTQLRIHHTATHIVYAACRFALGPHVWQHGANKTTEQAHLDITHYKSLTYKETESIERSANQIAHSCTPIEKSWVKKDIAEKKHGFHLYQGGIVPGNIIRVVNIKGIDTEACCGTHCDNTSEVGLIRIMRTIRISDGILRLYFTAGPRALEILHSQSSILHNLCNMWSVTEASLLDTGSKFFEGYKKYREATFKNRVDMLHMQLRALLLNDKSLLSSKKYPIAVFRSDDESPTNCISYVPLFAEELKLNDKGAIFIGNTFLYAIFGSESLFEKILPKLICSFGSDFIFKNNMKKNSVKYKDEKKKTQNVTEIVELKCFGLKNGRTILHNVLTTFQED